MPRTHQKAAEEVRHHLVTLRGGAPFLSPADSLLLVTWLDAGVSVVQILRAIERAAEARGKRPSRLPLTLRQVRRHLNKPMKSTFKPPLAPNDPHPLAPLANSLLGDHPPIVALRKELIGLSTDNEDELVRAAASAIRLFIDGNWRSLSTEGQTRYLDQAMVDLEDIAASLDEQRFHHVVDERARALHRRQWPQLNIATLWDLVDP